MTPPVISVIIPTLNEAANLGTLLDRLAEERVPHEIIVVDGGSEDGTVDIATAAEALVLSAPRGRGQQVVAGADAATGEILLFLHADSQFPKGGLAAVTQALATTRDAVGGNFRLLFDGGDDFSRWLDGFYARIRSRGVYYGDSAIFVRRAVYERLGGIRPIALMEDYDFVRRLEGAGETLCILEPAMITSSRRFRGRRKWAIIWGWIKIHLLYYLGVRPEALARLYDSERRTSMANQPEPQSDQREAASLRPQS